MIEDLRQLQMEELEILLEFKRLCQKYKLTYFLVAGTLLGAVRHQGFIPWDDDIDVAMPLADLKRFEQICKVDLDEKYFYQSENTDDGFYFCFSKLRKKDSAYFERALKNVSIRQGCYIDIFPLDGCFSSPFWSRTCFKIIEVLECALQTKVGADFQCAYIKKTARFVYHVACLFSKRFLLRIRRMLRFIMNHLSTGKILCTIGGAHGYPRETYRWEWLFPPAQLNFEGEDLAVPANWDSALANMYGDYLRQPPDEEKIGHLTEE